MGVIKFIRDLWEITHLNIDKKINIPYGVSDIEDIYKKKEFSTDKIKVLMITDFSEFLDNYTPIFAVNECNKEEMNIQLDIYGQGRDLSKIQNCIKNQNCENIQYKGSFQDFTPIYKDYDLFITSSYSCDIQKNTIEAMRAGLPLLLINTKGNNSKDFIKSNGLLTQENDIMAFRKIIKKLCDDKSQLTLMGQNSRKLYKEKYLSAKVPERYNYETDNIDVSVIIVNWNSGKLLEETIDSMFQKNIDCSFETIIIDNNSKKDEESYLYLEQLSKYKNITLVKSEKNLGFARANNLGMGLAKGRNFFLLNPDVLFNDNCLKILNDYLENNSDVGMVGPKVLSPDGSFQQPCLRGKPYPKDTLFHLIGLAKAFPNNEYFNGYALWHLDRNQIQECWAVMGCALMIKREVYDKIGGIDERYFMYQEETDWGIECRKAGYKVVYNPTSIITHYKGATTKQVQVKATWYFTQSMMKFFKKHFWDNYNIFQKAFWTTLIYGNFFLKLAIAKVRGK